MEKIGEVIITSAGHVYAVDNDGAEISLLDHVGKDVYMHNPSPAAEYTNMYELVIKTLGGREVRIEFTEAHNFSNTEARRALLIYEDAGISATVSRIPK